MKKLLALLLACAAFSSSIAEAVNYRTEDWEDKTTAIIDAHNAGSNGWYDRDATTNDRPVVDLTFGHNSNRSLKFNIEQDAVFAGTIRNWLNHSFVGGDTIHVRWYAYWSTNFLYVNSGSGSKSLYLNSYDAEGAESNWRARFEYNGITNTTAFYRIDTYPIDDQSDPNQAGSPHVVTRGVWTCIELGVTLNTFASAANNAAANSNGRMRWWINDVLDADYQNFPVRGTQTAEDQGGTNQPNRPITVISFDQYFGGATNEVGAHPEQFVWIDDVVVSDGPIGCIGGGGDTTPPVLTPQTMTGVTPSRATPSVSTDTAEGTLYMVIVPNNDTPSVAQIKLGQRSSGAAAIKAANVAVSTTGTITFSQQTGLDPNTALDAWFVHTDVAGNDSTAVKADFTTLVSGCTAPCAYLPLHYH